MAEDEARQEEAVEAQEPVQAEQAEAVDLEGQLAQAKAQADEYLDQWRRTAAEFSNYRKRIERERQEMSRLANAALLGRLLPLVDDLERAMATLPAELRLLSWVEGISLIGRKLEWTLESEGVRPIEAIGKPFDPEQHEAVLREETTEHPDGQVIAELQRGYMLHDRVLRPALVKVAVAPAAKAEAPASAGQGEPPAEEPASEAPSAEDTSSPASEQPEG